eukprot:4689-Heterococcus_DN1.PRE.1
MDDNKQDSDHKSDDKQAAAASGAVSRSNSTGTEPSDEDLEGQFDGDDDAAAETAAAAAEAAVEGPASGAKVSESKTLSFQPSCCIQLLLRTVNSNSAAASAVPALQTAHCYTAVYSSNTAKHMDSMLEECPTIVRWDAGSLCVLNPAALQQTVLPRYFRTA